MMFGDVGKTSSYALSVFYAFFYLALAVDEISGGLKCYKCLNLECPLNSDGTPNEKLCESIREFTVSSLRGYYELGNYVPPCPGVDETLQWSLQQQYVEDCPSIRDKATCSLGRMKITAISQSGLTIITHATILGCMKQTLLHHMRPFVLQNSCALLFINSTDQKTSLSKSPSPSMSLELENCPKITDYCNGKSFCIPFGESIVKPFVSSSKNSAFETGIVISIIVVILVVVAVLLLANFCKGPLSRSSNYSPPKAQEELHNSIESPLTESSYVIEEKNKDLEEESTNRPSTSKAHDV